MQPPSFKSNFENIAGKLQNTTVKFQTPALTASTALGALYIL